jgi:hypothetical protein
MLSQQVRVRVLRQMCAVYDIPLCAALDVSSGHNVAHGLRRGAHVHFEGGSTPAYRSPS